MSLADAGGAGPHRRVSLWRPVAQLPPHHQPPSTVVQGLVPSQAMQGEGGPPVTQRVGRGAVEAAGVGLWGQRGRARKWQGWSLGGWRGGGERPG